MAKNIVLLSDGTGNSSAKLFKTNVWRLYQALDHDNPTKQVAYYDDGVGTSSFKLFAILGGVFGFGLKRNVIDIYSFCCRNYQAGDKIYGFGFSRGAFTMRVVAGMIAREGLVRYNGNEDALARYSADAYRNYRRRFKVTGGLDSPLRAMRDAIIGGWRWLRGFPKETGRQEIETIHFLGVWDTVDAYGGPIEEITRAIDYWFWPLTMPDRFLNSKVQRACHALALEDERDAFRPVLWDERYVRHSPPLGQKVSSKLRYSHTGWTEPQPPGGQPLAPIDKQRISQVWFVGVHSDIGGGYPQDGLSYQTLDWMIDRAVTYGLMLDPFQQKELKSLVNIYDKLNDSRNGFGGYYRYKPRKIADLLVAPPYKPSIRGDWNQIKSFQKDGGAGAGVIEGELDAGVERVDVPAPMIHESVLARIQAETDGYAPIVLPGAYQVVTASGNIYPLEEPQTKKLLARDPATGSFTYLDPASQTPPHEILDSGTPRAQRQEWAWDWVWWRRVVYFATVAASVFLAAMPLLVWWRPGPGPASALEIIRPVIFGVGKFLPSFASPWIDAFAEAPGWFALGLAAVAILLYLGGTAQLRIRDIMRTIWRSPLDSGGLPDSRIYRLRNHFTYRAFFYILKHWILPSLFALLIALALLAVVYCIPAALSRLVFGVMNATGHVCEASKDPAPVENKASTAEFTTKDMCAPTKLLVRKGETYRVVIEVTDDWIDGDRGGGEGIKTDPRGFAWSRTSLPQRFGIPYRRLMWSDYFTTVLRVGSTGVSEHLLELWPGPLSDRGKLTFTGTFKPQKTGEVFVFVNDAIITLPYLYSFFYVSNNTGKATLTLKWVGPGES